MRAALSRLDRSTVAALITIPAGAAASLVAGASLAHGQWSRQAHAARVQAQVSDNTAAQLAPLLAQANRRDTLLRSLLADDPASLAMLPDTAALVTATTPRAVAAVLADQDAFAAAQTASLEQQSAAAERALRSLGLDPAAMLARSRAAQGGPLVALPGGRHALDPALRQLARASERWSLLADNLAALPSARPTDATMVTSSYGVRSDPFTHSAAFHAGLDFVGRYGQPIHAAAPGKVVFVGQRSGYGNVVEIDHGSGILTRYAHLSGFDTHVGEEVARGEDIARMGSTGRSTGTHLHFEVRINGAPQNPRRFLSAGQQLAAIAAGNRQS